MPAGATLLESLRRSGIVSSSRMQRIQTAARRWSSLPDAAVARKLVSAKILTAFQAEELLRGNFRRLRIGPFVIQEVLGFGGMGHVYRARDLQARRPVALKVLAKRFQHDKGMRARFRLEAEAGLRLHHPHLVQTLSFGQLEELYGEVDYMVMEFFEGIALHELVTRCGRLKFDTVCDIAGQAASGLQHMHDQSLVHRDIKPDNVLINHQGVVKLLDFGLALADERAFEDEFSLSMIFGQDGLGTLDYMAPEQSYDSLQVDARADVYSLGCTLFAVLTGKRPFPYPSRSQVLEAHRTEPAPSVLLHAPQTPPEIAAMIQRMMAKAPADRFPSMQAVADALAPFARRRPVPFDFGEILNRRRDEAQARLSRQGRSLTQTVRRESTTSRHEPDAALRPTTMAQETDVRHGVAPAVQPPPDPPSDSSGRAL